MSFVKVIKIPSERIGVLIGKSGRVKAKIEKSCGVKIEIDSENGDTTISTSGDLSEIQPFKAVEVVNAIARGFSPDVAMTLLKEDCVLQVIDIRQFAGKSSNNLERIKGRLIGESGKARKNMEDLTGAHISIYGKTISVIGDSSRIKQVLDAIESLSSGSMHGKVYSKLESANRQNKLERMKLWEDQDVF